MRKNMKGGFTLVELSLSIVFISILSIIIVLLINNAIASYRRGLTLNEINTVGMDLVDDIRTVVQSSPSGAVIKMCSGLDNEKICESNGAKNLVSIVVKKDMPGMGNIPVYGAFCTGLYSYIWNSGYFFNGKIGPSESAAYLMWKGKSSSVADGHFGEETGEEIKKIIKIKDNDRSVCRNSAIVSNRYVQNISSNVFSLGEVEDPVAVEAVDLLASSDNINLAVYDFSALAPAVSASGNVSFYSMSFILGTVQGGINVMASGNFCQTPADGDEDENFNYCAINKFNFAAQAIGKERT